MKTHRQSKILELIRNNNVETQADLLEMLRNDGFNVTQATVSRDIKEMRLIKVLGSNGAYRYATEVVSPTKESADIYLYLTAVVSVDYAHTMVVIKTKSGMAQAVCAALDSTHWAGVLGSIAGDDTIFVAARTEAAALNLVSDLKKLISNNNSI